ncbi:arylamine N-acetyltransferase [Nonomuraea sp. NPDC049684]|uniref:arylamine N-acetyltransferase family protein n=1 Tax=unclassified Nonomuraea TaxID=2593643 RepID=UPI0037AFA2A1
MRRTRDRDLNAYLDRLDVGDPGEPSLPALRALHRAHVERVPYETLEVQLGRRITVDPRESVERVLRGRGGYCVQLNGAFATLLTALGYDVTWHRAGVQAAVRAPASPASFAPHLALTVALDGQDWLVDIGLGDGLHEPLPLRAGTYRQGPFEFRLSASDVEPGGWRFDHDPRGSIAGLDVERAPAEPGDFVEWHPYLCTSPESRLVRAAVVLRRDATGADCLVGCMLRRIGADGRTERELSTRREWFGALEEVFGLRLDDVNGAEREALWTKVHDAHLAWQSRRRTPAA